MNAFDPEMVQGGKRRIASHYYPMIGPYDSSDSAVIEYHLLLMKLAGVDGLIADWYGLTDHFDYAMVHRNTAALFEPAAKFGLKIGICYEDQTISELVKANKLSASERVPHARKELEWLRTHWFGEPVYLKVKGQPVLLSFGQSGLTDREWEEVLHLQSNAPLYLSEHRRRSAAAGAFDWPVPQNVWNKLDSFYNTLKDWPVAMPVAFPRFHDIYSEAGVHASWGQIPDDGGRTFIRTFGRALESKTALVQIATWNDWGEGTMIEPSEQFGYRDLEAVQRLRRERIDPQFAYQPGDLRLAHRLFLLRRHEPQQPLLRSELDKVARQLAAGALSDARAALENIEAVIRWVYGPLHS